mmetsp:Transcript_15870/g.28710  ORF Transcript_15870/g.28710 Transcript_15870/m.28710 type:complete len:215 (-) Transcript_15870:268-912(-)
MRRSSRFWSSSSPSCSRTTRQGSSTESRRRSRRWRPTPSRNSWSAGAWPRARHMRQVRGQEAAPRVWRTAEPPSTRGAPRVHAQRLWQLIFKTVLRSVAPSSCGSTSRPRRVCALPTVLVDSLLFATGHSSTTTTRRRRRNKKRRRRRAGMPVGLRRRQLKSMCRSRLASAYQRPLPFALMRPLGGLWATESSARKPRCSAHERSGRRASQVLE